LLAIEILLKYTVDNDFQCPGGRHDYSNIAPRRKIFGNSSWRGPALEASSSVGGIVVEYVALTNQKIS